MSAQTQPERWLLVRRKTLLMKIQLKKALLLKKREKKTKVRSTGAEAVEVRRATPSL